MRGYFGLGQISATEKQNILDQHKSLYNGYQTMQPQVSNTQPLHVYDFAGDKDGMVVNNKGEVKKYTNMGINEQVETLKEKWEGDVKVKKTGEHAGKTVEQLKKELESLKKKSKSYQDKDQAVPKSIIDQEAEIKFAIRAKQGWKKGEGSMNESEKQMCEQCGGTMREDVCEQCGSKMEGEVEEGVGKLDDIYDVNDLGDNDFDYVEGGGNNYGTFEKMHHMKKIKSEGKYEDPDNEDDAIVGSEDLQIDSSEMYEDKTDDMPYEKGSRGMKASRARASFIPTPQENEILNNLFGQYGEDIPPIVIRYLRKLPRKTLLNRLVKVGLIDKDLLKGSETIDEQGYTGGGNTPMNPDTKPAYNFQSGGPDEVYPTEGEMEEQISPDQILYYKRRGIVYSNILSFIEAAKADFDMCRDFGDEFEYADNIISSALTDFFVQIGEDLDSDFYYEVHDLCKDWFGDDLITEFAEECGGQEEEEEEDFMFMESAFADEIDEVDVSGSQGIYGEMDPPYDFDSKGPGSAGPYQRSSYNEEEVEDEEEFEIDEDLQESFHNQKNKIVEMMSRMKVIK